MRSSAVAVVLALAACSGNLGDDGMELNDWPEQRVVVDDEVIDSGDLNAVIDPVWWAGNIYEGPLAYEQSLDRFSKRQRLIFAAVWYLSEVNNGGHDQFYSNSTGIVWPDAQQAFSELNVPDVVEIIRESAVRLGGSPSRVRKERWSQMEAAKASFDDLDDPLYELQDTTDLDKLMIEYINKHREDFYFDGLVHKPGS